MSNVLVFDVDERCTALYQATLEDENGNPIPLVSISALTMTLIEVSAGGIVNSRSNQDVLNANNCTLHATSGLFSWQLQPDDNSIDNQITPRINQSEEHLATFTVSWGSQQLNWEVRIRVRNLRRVPQG